jgi:hypothetical protein
MCCTVDMIHPDFTHCTTLKQFYNEACDLFISEYGEHFTLYWEHIRELAQHCDSYKELGAFQGVSAAAAMLGNPDMRYIELIDVTFKQLIPHRQVFAEFRGKLKLIEKSSVDPSLEIIPVDMMLVDSLHDAKHVAQELRIHAASVARYIIFHDATYVPIKKVIDRFVSKNKEWRYLIYDDRSFGYAVIEKNLS